MEKDPQWDQTAENLMNSLARDTDPSQLRTYQEEIKIVECENERGSTSFVSIDGKSPAGGPFVSKPFNPSNN